MLAIIHQFTGHRNLVFSNIHATPAAQQRAIAASTRYPPCSTTTTVTYVRLIPCYTSSCRVSAARVCPVQVQSAAHRLQWPATVDLRPAPVAGPLLARACAVLQAEIGPVSMWAGLLVLPLSWLLTGCVSASEVRLSELLKELQREAGGYCAGRRLARLVTLCCDAYAYAPKCVEVVSKQCYVTVDAP